MKKEDLIAMGLTDEQAGKVLEAHKAAIDAGYVTKTRFNEVNEENKTLKQSVSDRDKQLDELKKSNGNADDLKKQIETLQQQNAEQKKTHDAEMAQLRLDNALEVALSGAKAKNNRAVKGMLDMSKVKLNEDGTLAGFNEQIEALLKSDAYLFDTQPGQAQQNFKGFQPGASGNVKPGTEVDTSKMTYSEMLAYLEANPDAKIE